MAETPMEDYGFDLPIGDAANGTDDGPVQQEVHRANTRTLQKDPLAGLTNAELKDDARRLAQAWSLESHMDAFEKGALLAKVQNDDYGFDALEELNTDERDFLKFEVERTAWSLPLLQWLQAALCALCAIVQGMDQTIINGAQVDLLWLRDII